MNRRQWLLLMAIAVVVIGSLVVATGSLGRALPVWDPGYHGQLPPASDPAYAGQDATSPQGSDVECSDTDMSNPADDPVCPSGNGSPVPNPSSDTTGDEAP